MFKTRRNKYGKQLKNKKSRKTLRKKGKRGGFLTTSGFGIGNFKFSKTEGAKIYNPKTGQWDYRDCYSIGPINLGCKERAP